MKADFSEAGEGLSDSRNIEAPETSALMLYRVRRQLVEEGLEAVLNASSELRRLCRQSLSSQGGMRAVRRGGYSVTCEIFHRLAPPQGVI